MGILRDVIGSALQGNDVNNGLSGTKFSFTNNNSNTNYSSSSWQNRPLPFRQQDASPMNSDYDGRSQQDWRQTQSTRPPTSFDTLHGTTNEHHRLSYQGYYDSPPPYDPRDPTLSTGYTQSENDRRQSYGLSQAHAYNSFSPARDSRPSSNGAFRPLALPQINYGDGQPFLRGYSSELAQYGVFEREFIEIIDAINVAIVPNPENRIFQKGANIAGWFL